MVLHSYNYGYGWTDSIMKGIEAVLPQQDYNLTVEYMDTKRYEEPAYFSKLYDLYHYKFASKEFDVIICSDDNAFNLLKKHKSDLFAPQTPVVFCGVNFFQDADLKGRQDITGVVENYDIAGTIEIIRNLHPNLKEILVISDRTATGISNTLKARKAMAEQFPQQKYALVDDVTMDDLLQILGRAPVGTVVLYLGFAIDKTGKSYAPLEESLALISRHSKLPFYSVWEFTLESVVGGMITSGYYQGEMAARMAKRLMDGEKVATIPVVKESPNKPMFNYKQIEHYGISPPQLPPGSIIINRPGSFYETHKSLVLGISAVMTVLILVIIVLTININKRKRAEEELRMKERLLDGASDSIFLHDLEGHFLYLNKAAYRDRGYEKEELLDRDLSALITPEFVGMRQALVTDLLAQGEIIFESAHRRKDGSVMPVEIHARTIDLGDQQLILSAARNITKRKQAEEKFLKEVKLSDTIIDSLPGIFYSFDDQGRFLRWNANFERVTGYTSAEFADLTPSDFFVGEEKNLIAEAIQEVFLRGENTAEAGLVTKNGSKIHHFFTGRRLDCDGTPCLIGTGIDISARKMAEQELLSAAEKWRTTFDAIGDAVCLLDEKHRILQCNQAMAALLGKPFTDIIGQTCCELVHGTNQPIEACPFVRLRQSRGRETLTFPHGDCWLRVVADPILSENGEIIGSVHIIADITDYQQATQKIIDLNTLLKAIKEIDEALLRVKSEADLYQQICNLLLEVPYVRFTWIGLVQPESFELKIVAHAGYEEGYLTTMRVTYDDTEFGRGPSGEAIRTRLPVIIRDMETDPRSASWRGEAQKRGYRSNIGLPLIYQKEIVGVLRVYSGQPDAFGAEEIEFLNQVAGDIAVGIKSLRLEQELVQGVIKLQIMIHQTVETMGSIVETRDPYTAGHQKGVAHLAGAIAAEMDLDADRLQGLQVAGLLHDIGKMSVPSEILSKPGKLSEIEFSIIKDHSQVGADILGKIDFPWPVAQIVLQHHERLDGSGYPQGLAAQDILLEARILAVADVVEAMSSHRPYRPTLGIDSALKEITKNKGTLYDPEAVEACVKLFVEKEFKFEA